MGLTTHLHHLVLKLGMGEVKILLHPYAFLAYKGNILLFLFYFSPTFSSCATNRKVVGSIPTGVSGFFIDIKSLRSHYGPGVDSASNRNEYQEYFLGVKATGA